MLYRYGLVLRVKNFNVIKLSWVVWWSGDLAGRSGLAHSLTSLLFPVRFFVS